MNFVALADQTLGEIRFDADGDGNDNVCHPPVNTSTELRMFFKWRVTVNRVEE